MLYVRDIDRVRTEGSGADSARKSSQGDATREQGRLLTTLADLRQQADYGYDRIDADIDELAERTRTFVERMTALVESATEETGGR